MPGGPDEFQPNPPKRSFIHLSSTSQQPLEMSPAMAVTMAVILTVGWMGWAGSEVEPDRFAVRPVIQRVSNQTVVLDEFSIVIQPTTGWIHLAIMNEVQANPTFINPAANIVVDFRHPHTGEATPPGRQAHYQHVDIVWPPPTAHPGGAKLYEGWIISESGTALMRVLINAKEIESESSLTALCNSIQQLDDRVSR